MKNKLSYSKTFSQEPDSLLIRALAPAASGGFQAVSFEKHAIDHLVAGAKGFSGIVLKSGAHIPVALPFSKLEQSIYFANLRDTPVLDLSAHTGPVAQQQVLPALAGAFFDVSTKKKQTVRPDTRSQEGMYLTFFVRKARTDNYQMYRVHESKINWGKVESESGRNGPIIRLPLYTGTLSPFREQEILIEMPHAEFMEVYAQAKMKGQAELDLTSWTRPRTEPKNVSFKKIFLFIREPGTQNYQLDVTTGKEAEEVFDWEKIYAVTSDNGPATMIPLKDGVHSKFGDREMLADIPYELFMQRYTEAKMRGDDIFDLREETKPQPNPNPGQPVPASKMPASGVPAPDRQVVAQPKTQIRRG